MLFIKTQTRTHAHTHAHKSILSKIIFFKCLFEQDFRWFIANRKGEIVPYSNKRHQHEKLNYLNTQKNYPASRDAAIIIAGRWWYRNTAGVFLDHAKAFDMVNHKISARKAWTSRLSVYKLSLNTNKTRFIIFKTTNKRQRRIYNNNNNNNNNNNKCYLARVTSSSA